MANQVFPQNAKGPPKLGELLQDIGNDVRTLAVDEIELARGKLATFLQQLIVKAAGAIVGGCLALIGLGMLCLAAVAALAPVIPALWLRLVIMAAVYLAIGGGLVVLFMKRMAAVNTNELKKPIAEVGETLEAVKNGLEH